jgi:hypothetical protein
MDEHVRGDACARFYLLAAYADGASCVRVQGPLAATLIASCFRNSPILQCARLLALRKFSCNARVAGILCFITSGKKRQTHITGSPQASAILQYRIAQKTSIVRSARYRRRSSN